MNTFLTSLVAGFGSGAVYALIAVGFVIIYRATGVLNFAQPALVILGAFFTSLFAVDLGLPFPLAVVLGVAVVVAISMLTERVALRPMVGKSAYSAAVVTVGVFFVLLMVAYRLFDGHPKTVNDPWQLNNFCFGGEIVETGFGTSCEGGVIVYEYNIAKFVIAMIVIIVLGIWLTRSRLGLAMRATALDQETALAQGINVGRIFSTSWAIGGGLAALAGVLMAANGSVIQATDALFALVALPAIILGGLDSIKGAVIGGFVIGIAMSLTKTYQLSYAPWLGANFENVVPYLIMLLVLLVKPFGLYGTKEVVRV
ncbi:MAG: branched-chain amino acid ABC transporter permease [Microbacteriaceae bacterium]